MKILLLFCILFNFIFADDFYKIKLKLLNKGVSQDYISKVFSLDEFNIIDERTLSILHPSKINKLKLLELDANEAMLKKEKELKQHLINYKSVYDIAESKYFVNREIIASILMKETKLGKFQLNHTLLSSLSTIYKKYDKLNIRDTKYRLMAERSLIDIISFAYKHNYDFSYLQNIKSSYAGAIGFPQFMPFNLKYAISYNNSIPDLNKMEDAILSIAFYLNKQANWKSLIDWHKVENIEFINSKWTQYKKSNGWISLASPKQDSFLKKEYIRPFAIKLYSYNNSSEYVMGVLRLAYKIKEVK